MLSLVTAVAADPKPASSALPGTLVGGRYRLLRSLGSDGYGELFASESESGVHTVRVLSGLADAAAATALFGEVSSATGTEAPHVVRVVDHGVDRPLGAMFVVSEPFEGQTLSSVLERLGPLEPSAVAGIGIAIATALEEAHSTGMAHGAITPERVILLTTNGNVEVRLGGFEVARIAALRGPDLDHSPSYSAPERLQFPKKFDPTSDVWSLGAVLYRALTGSPPVDQTLSAEGVLETLTRSGVRHIQDVAPWVPPGLARAIHATLLRDTQLRCQFVDDFAAALRPFAAPEPLKEASLQPLHEATRATAAPRAGLPARWSEVQVTPAESSATYSRMLGVVLDKKYKLIRHIGAGGMGAVYEAEAPDGTHVAIKVIQAEHATADSPALKRFVREAQSSQAIKSDHVVKVFDAGTDEALGIPYIAMELLTGTDVSELIRTIGAVAPEMAARIFVDALDGLQAAHELGLVHRDIKPANIFLHEMADGRVVAKVCDFGIAKQLSTFAEHTLTELTHTGGIIGSPIYMSPEQSQSAKTVDPRSDLWSMSVALYRALAGKHPWQDCANVAQIVLSIHTQDAPPIQDGAPWVEAGLAAAVHRGLKRDRNRRWQTAADMRAALLPYAAPELHKSDLQAVAEERRLVVAERANAEDMTEPPSETMVTALEAEAAERHAAEQQAYEIQNAKETRKRNILYGAVLSTLLLGGGAYYFLRSKPLPMAAQAPQEVPCKADTDCGRAGDRFICGEASICVKAIGCISNAECTAQNKGTVSVCHKLSGSCNPLESEDCKIVGDAKVVENDATIWLGTMFPLKGPDADRFGTENARAADLAREDFMKVANGLPSQASGGPTRPLGIISCDDSENPERAAKHLIEQVQVPAVIGFRTQEELVSLSNSLFVPKGVVAIAALDRSSGIGDITSKPGNPRYVWRTATSGAMAAGPIGALIAEFLEPKLRASVAELKGDKPMKIALVRSNTSAGAAFADALTKSLKFNGKTTAENETNFHDFAYDVTNGEAQVGALVDQIAEFGPRISILSGEHDPSKSIMAPLEARLRGGPNGMYYVMDGPLEGPAAVSLLKGDKTRSKRFLSVGLPSTVPANVKFTMRYNSAYSAHLSPSTSPASPYDSVYLLAFAAYAAGDGHISGASLAKAIPKLLPPGKPIEVGPATILDGFSTLRNGTNIDLHGASTKFDFDVTTGESPSDYAVFCIKLNEKQTEIENSDSGAMFAASTSKLQGTPNCL